MKTVPAFLVLLTGCLVLIQPATAEETWPSWRGPRGDGSSPDQTVPLEWNVKETLKPLDYNVMLRP